MNLKSPLGKARGLGSAKEGSKHWWHQRITAIALVFLSLWFVISLITLTGAGYGEVYSWLSRPDSSILAILTILFSFYHLKLGIQVIAEDYIHTEWKKLFVIILTDFGCIVIALTSVLSVLLVSIGGQ